MRLFFPALFLTACGLTENSPSNGSEGPNTSGAEADASERADSGGAGTGATGSGDAGSGGEGSGGGDAGGASCEDGGCGGDAPVECGECPEAHPVETAPEVLIEGLSVPDALTALLETVGPDRRVWADESGIALVSADDGIHRYADGRTSLVLAHVNNHSNKEQGEDIYPGEGAAFAAHLEESGGFEQSPLVARGFITRIDLSGVPTEVLAREGEGPGAATAIGSEVFSTFQSGTWASGLYSSTGMGESVLESGTLDGPLSSDGTSLWGLLLDEGATTLRSLVEILPDGSLARTESLPALFGVAARPDYPIPPRDVLACGDEIVVVGFDVWIFNAASSTWRLLDPGGVWESSGISLQDLQEIAGQVPVAVACNSWAIFWSTVGPDENVGELKMQRKGESDILILEDERPRRGLFATDDFLYWMKPGNKDGQLLRSSLDSYRP